MRTIASTLEQQLRQSMTNSDLAEFIARSRMAALERIRRTTEIRTVAEFLEVLDGTDVEAKSLTFRARFGECSVTTIYRNTTAQLYSLLDEASSQSGATLLIPDLQRPYVWSPRQ